MEEEKKLGPVGLYSYQDMLKENRQKKKENDEALESPNASASDEDDKDDNDNEDETSSDYSRPKKGSKGKGDFKQNPGHSSEAEFDPEALRK